MPFHSRSECSDDWEPGGAGDLRSEAGLPDWEMQAGQWVDELLADLDPEDQTAATDGTRPRVRDRDGRHSPPLAARHGPGGRKRVRALVAIHEDRIRQAGPAEVPLSPEKARRIRRGWGGRKRARPSTTCNMTVSYRRDLRVGQLALKDRAFIGAWEIIWPGVRNQTPWKACLIEVAILWPPSGFANITLSFLVIDGMNGPPLVKSGSWLYAVM